MHRNQRLDSVHPLRLPSFGMELRINVSRANRVNADPFLGNFLRQSDSKRVDRSFARRVVHVFAGEPYLAAPEETLTIPPPFPPCLLEILRTASRAQSIEPSTFVARIRKILGASIESSRI